MRLRKYSWSLSMMALAIAASPFAEAQDAGWYAGASVGQARAKIDDPGITSRLLGEGFAGVLHRDRWRPYAALVAATHQLCWAHLRRDFQAMLEAGGETGVQGAMLLLASDRAFAWWRRLLDGEVSRVGLARARAPSRWEVRERLARIRDGDGPRKARGTARDLLRQEASLWTYVGRDGAVPTNNEAERGIRKAVLWRKGSFGANAEAGCRFVERILTVVGTARRRAIEVLAWLTGAIRTFEAGRVAPTLAIG